MALRNQHSSLCGETGTALPAAVSVALPSDVLFEVLLRLTAKDLCRLRAVCRTWSALTFDPTFVAAHATRHPGPLLVGGVLDFQSFPSVDILLMDLSGNVVKRIRHAGTHLVLPTHHDLLCVTEAYSCKASLLNPVTGAVCALPETLSRIHARRRVLSDFDGSFYYGRDSSGVCKVLRSLTDYNQRLEQFFEVLTLNASSPMQWWEADSLPMFVRTEPTSSAIVKGVVYFLLDGRANGPNDPPELEIDLLARFDLKTEEWLPFLRGPVSCHPELSEIDDILNEPYVLVVDEHLALSELNDVLVVAQHTGFRSTTRDSFLDLWYLVDSEKCLWERKYRFDLELSIHEDGCYFAKAHASLILDDGRILICIYVGSNFPGQYTRRVVRLYDPETQTLSSDLVDVRNVHSIGFYKGSLLSLQNGGRLLSLCP
ncbi:hypothetical protein GUJ93_ZPchr0013g35378 [Zizania palustris]|nr:hypothetical protein GUJ93_ZPchr0013g35378 [Zizania palustris]